MTPEQCKAARALLKLEQAELANAASVARTTVIDFETGSRTPRSGSVAKLRAALEAAGVEFIAQDNGGPGVRLRGRNPPSMVDDG